MDVVINHEQELFVVSAGKGYSTLGFEHVFKQLKQLVARLNLSIQIREDEKGTIGQYADFQRAINEAAKANLKETWFNLDTPVKVRRILEQYRRSGKAIRIFYGDVERALVSLATTKGLPDEVPPDDAAPSDLGDDRVATG